MKYLNSKIWSYLFLLVGIGNFLMMIDTLFSSADQTFTILSISTNKWMNVAFFAVIAFFLIYSGIYQNKKFNENKNQNEDAID
ncbi:MAG: hypothetical protein WBV45_05165 [Lutimonas sp.]